MPHTSAKPSLFVKGLVALWREALLAQKVLKGETKGYKNHPQLNRFKETSEPVFALASYLKGVETEAIGRGYQFDGTKIVPHGSTEQIPVTTGQLEYELSHLKHKLKIRDEAKLFELESLSEYQLHPSFYLIEGDIEPWEIIG